MPNRIHKPKGFYLSYSRINCYYNSPQEYFMRYVMGVKPKATPNMELGSIGHLAASDRSSQAWRQELRDKRFMSSDERMIERALLQLPVCERHEEEFTVKWNGITLYGIIDGIDQTSFRERKFAAPGAWNQEKVDEDMQISFYWFVMNQMGHRPTSAYLDHINNHTGRVKSYRTTRNKNDMLGMENLINYVYKGIKAEAWN